VENMRESKYKTWVTFINMKTNKNKLTKSQRFNLALNITDAIREHVDVVYNLSEFLPFSGTNVGQTKVVTTGTVGFYLDQQLRHKVMEILRNS